MRQALHCLKVIASWDMHDALPKSHHLSYRHRKRLLSTEAQALLISGNTPQKQPFCTALYRSSTMPGMLLATGDRGLSTAGHCSARNSSLREFSPRRLPGV